MRFLPGDAVPRVRHVFVIVMENRGARAILDGGGDPYLRALARRYAVDDAFYAVRHPSLPNYLALTAGTTFGVHSDSAPPTLSGPNVTDALARAGRTFGAYMDGLPRKGYLGASYLPGLYAGKHDPFRYFPNVRRSAARRGRIQPLGVLWPALSTGRVPNLVWITPDLCHDMHSCPTLAGDSWLRLVVPRLLASAAWRQGGLMFILWDEGSGSSPHAPGHGGRVALYVIAPGLRPASRLSAPAVNDYALLHTILRALGAPCVRQSCTAPVLDLAALRAAGQRPAS